MCIPPSTNLFPIQYLDSPDRKSFLAEFGPGGKYENTVAIYRENESSEKIGTFDEELISGLPSSIKWIAHNGAGYDPVDVHACKSRGNCNAISSQSNA
jgi:phosphoglycerate dehydrogenase-like enzyme